MYVCMQYVLQVSKGNYENAATFQYASTLVTKIIKNNNSQSNFDFTQWFKSLGGSKLKKSSIFLKIETLNLQGD